MIPVEFAGPGALMLRGLRFGEADRWAVLVHGEGRDLDGWRPLAGWLADHGLSVLAFDLPGHGASDDPWEPTLALPAVVAAIDFARSEGSRQVHLGGEGFGAIAALAAAADHTRQVASIVALSPNVHDHVGELIEVREARAPKLILVGSLSPDALEGAEAVFRGAIGHCEIVKFPVSAQGTDLLAGEWGVHARHKVLEHLVRQL
ncbi:MAG TPA: alpha/beta fold hydrolase [Candidatus Dormibacteraeota bacterium]|nr:alpha/beta fold hydrolase [Candidatus Dormibacteraeota bacterium]